MNALSVAVFGQVAPLSLEAIAHKNRDSIVVIQTFNRNGDPVALGSGVVLPNATIATNYHVLEGACRVLVSVRGMKQPFPIAMIVSADEKQDLAVFIVMSTALKPTTIGAAERLQPGARVLVIGNPEGLNYSVSDGVVAAREF